MTKGLKAIADELGVRIRWGKTDESPTRQFCLLESVELHTGAHIGPAVGYGTDMRAAAEDLARVLRGNTVQVMNGAEITRKYTMPLEINPRKYK